MKTAQTPVMSGDQFEKAFTLRHYTDVAGQAQEDRRQRDRRISGARENHGRRQSDILPACQAYLAARSMVMLAGCGL